MKNRILTVIIALSMILSVFTVNVSAENDNDYSQAEQICLGLGCISVKDYKRDEIVTRAEFAKMIADLCRMDTDTSAQEWNDSAYGEVNETEPVILDKNHGYFNDVDKSHPYYNEIVAVYNAGYMKGISERRFAPEYDITVLEAAKVITDMLGYAKMAELQGGYPTGYENIITQIGLTNGVTKGFREIAHQRDILEIIYNALKINIIEFKLSDEATFEESDKTFMEGVLKTYKVKGIITDNGITAVDSETLIRKNEIKVGDVVASLTDDLFSYKKFIGRNVEMYYTFDENTDEYIVRYIVPASNDETVTFNIDDFISFDGNTIKYSLGKKTISESVDVNSNLIYNNKYVGVYDKSIFDFESGDVTLCSSNGDKYDIIIINDYEFVYVNGKNDNENLIYNGLKSASNNIIELTEEKYPDFMVIQDEAAKAMNYEDIAVGDILNILSCEGGIEIIVSRGKVKDFKVSSTGKSDLERTVISNNSAEYEVLDSYVNNEAAVTISLNETYTLHLNKFGKVVWLSGVEKEGYQVGILTKVTYDEESEAEPLRMIRIYTEGGIIAKLNATEKIAINGKKGKFEEKIHDLEELIGDAILYKTDENGNVCAIISAADFMDEDASDRGWHRINPEGSYSYGANGNDLGGFFYYVRGNTKVFTVPEDKNDYSDENNFSVGVAVFGDNKSYVAEGFATSPNAIEAEVIVLRQAATSGGSIDAQSVFVIQSISEGITADDEVVMELKGYTMKSGSNVAENVVLQLDPEAIMVGMGETATQVDQNADIATVGPRTPKELEAGDVIRYNTNAKGFVDVIRIAYDYDLQKPYHGSQGTEESNFAQASSFAGWALSKEGNGIRFSKSIRPENVDYKNVTELLANVKAMRLNNAPVLVVEKKGKKVNVRVGSVNDIVTYNDSRASGGYDRVAVFTYYSSLTYGAVVYK